MYLKVVRRKSEGVPKAEVGGGRGWGGKHERGRPPLLRGVRGISPKNVYAPNFEKVGSILLSACLCVCVCALTDGYSGGYKVWTIRHTSSHL